MDIPNYGLRTVLPDNHVFFTAFSTKARLEVSLQVGDRDFKKIKFLFQELEDVPGQQRKRQKNLIEIYCDPDELLGEFVMPILKNTLYENAKKDLISAVKALQSGKAASQPITLFSRNGGTPNKRGNGVAEYRDMKLIRSNLNDRFWNSSNPQEKAKSKQIRMVLRASACDGRVINGRNGQSLITPVLDNSKHMVNLTSVNFPITNEQLQALAIDIINELQAYRSSQYVTMEIGRVYQELLQVFSAIGIQQTDQTNKTDSVAPTANNDSLPENQIDAIEDESMINDDSMDINPDDLPF